MRSFGGRLRHRAEQLHLRDAEVARRLEISPRRYSYYVNDERQPDFALILRMCRVLETHPNYLLGYSNDPTDDFGNLSPDEVGLVKRYRSMVEAAARGMLPPFRRERSSPSDPDGDESREFQKVKVGGRKR